LLHPPLFVGLHIRVSRRVSFVAMPWGIMAKILLAGYVRELVEDSDKALRSAGYDVTLALTYADALLAAEQQVFDIAVLGYTVPEEERSQLARVIKQTSPATQIIIFYFDDVSHSEHADVLIRTTASAEDLLRAVEYTVSKHDRSRTG
jgi:CheY-like chemotaxis protein